MRGPCLCGDPYCPSCGSPGAAEAEAAEQWAIDRLAEAKISPDEIQFVINTGLDALKRYRELRTNEMANREPLGWPAE